MQPGVGYTFTNSGQGSNLNIEQPWSPIGLISASAEEQFQIVVTPYVPEGSEGPPTQSLIRVVKGEVVWSPKIFQPDPLIPVPISLTCTSQTTITDWYGGIPYTSIDDNQDAYIGDGGLLLSNSPVNIGIFIFKATNLPEDYDPIIVATPNFTPSCPVTFPGTPPVEDAFWDVVKIGSVQYTAPNPEADPPVAGGWVITQKFIGSMTLPGDGKGNQEPTTTPQLPGQLYYNAGTTGSVAPFEFNIVNSNGNRYLQIGKGTASFNQSNMPSIWYGPFTHIKQALFTKVQITPCPRATVEDIWPYGFPDEDPSYSLNMWMEDGGGYLLSDTNNPVTLYAFKWDANSTLLPSGTSNPIISSELPTLALIASTNSADYAKINKDNGPSIYEQTMNIKPMSGYGPDETGLPNDWGYCHTTWLNPRKIGFNCKAIGSVVAVANSFNCVIGTDRSAIPNVQNMVQGIYLLGDVRSGSITFTCGASAASTVPFPAINTIVPGGYGSVSSDELTLAACLNSIPPFIYEGETITLAGNVQVSKATQYSYYVTFVNELQGMNLPALVANTSAVVPYAYTLQIVQYHTGMLDLTTPMQMGMTQLMNKADMTEADDPYNLNADGSPEWNAIANKDDAINCENFAGDVTTAGVYSMSGFTNNNPDFTIPDSCGDACDHPFQVRRSGSAESIVWSICTGMINNVLPDPEFNTFTMTDGLVWLKVGFDGQSFPGGAYAITAGHGATVPEDTDDYGYIVIASITDDVVTQLVGGSLWGDRIKIGTQTATYYFAQV